MVALKLLHPRMGGHRSESKAVVLVLGLGLGVGVRLLLVKGVVVGEVTHLMIPSSLVWAWEALAAGEPCPAQPRPV